MPQGSSLKNKWLVIQPNYRMDPLICVYSRVIKVKVKVWFYVCTSIWHVLPKRIGLADTPIRDAYNNKIWSHCHNIIRYQDHHHHWTIVVSRNCAKASACCLQAFIVVWPSWASPRASLCSPIPVRREQEVREISGAEVIIFKTAWLMQKWNTCLHSTY